MVELSGRRGPVVAIGLGAGNAELVEHFADAGELPSLCRLRNQGIWARLEGIEPTPNREGP